MILAIFLCLLSIGAFLAGCAVAIPPTNAIHEIEALLLFLISALFFVGAAIIIAICDLIKVTKKQIGKP